MFHRKRYPMIYNRNYGVILSFCLILLIVLCIFKMTFLNLRSENFNDAEFKKNVSKNLLLGDYALKYLTYKRNSSRKGKFTEQHYSTQHDSYIDLHNFTKVKRTEKSSQSLKPFEYVIFRMEHNQFNDITVELIMGHKIKKNLTTLEKLQVKIGTSHLYRENEPLVSELLTEMATSPFAKFKPNLESKTFKLIVKFENGNWATFKPMRSLREEQTQPQHFHFSDYERHNAEIAVFHLDRLLGFRHTFPVTGRKLHMNTEIYNKSYHKLQKNFFISPAPANKICFYSKDCDIYCDINHAFCGDPDVIEGSLTAMLPQFEEGQRKKIPYPWKRSPVLGEKANWEIDENFCDKLRDTPPYDRSARLLDMMDLAIIDFLTGNHDRNEYEVLSHDKFHGFSSIIYSDNGRSFGRAFYDDMMILTPVDQCCLIRESTMSTLLNFHNGGQRLSAAMRESLKNDPIGPILWEPHLQALDRRVQLVLDAVRACVDAVKAYQIEFMNKTDLGPIYKPKKGH